MAAQLLRNVEADAGRANLQVWDLSAEDRAQADAAYAGLRGDAAEFAPAAVEDTRAHSSWLRQRSE